MKIEWRKYAPEVLILFLLFTQCGAIFAQARADKPQEPPTYRWAVTVETGIDYQWSEVKPVVSEIFSTYFPSPYGKVSVAYRIKSDWWLGVTGIIGEFNPAVTLSKRPRLAWSTGWDSPLSGGSVTVTYAGLSGKRFSLPAFANGGVYHLSPNSGISRLRIMNSSNQPYLDLTLTPAYLQSWMPYFGLGIRPEARLTRDSRLWMFLLFSGQLGWKKGAGLDLVYFTAPSHTTAHKGGSTYSGSGWNMAIGLKLYLGNKQVINP